MRISRVQCFQLSGSTDSPGQEERQVGMLDIYPEFAARGPRPASGRLSATYVQIDTDDGPSGLFGPLFEETATLIARKLAPYLLGQDPLAGERLWDVLYRQDRHSRKGYEMMAISAVDNALWDLRGKHFGLPPSTACSAVPPGSASPATPPCSGTPWSRSGCASGPARW